MRNHPIAAMNYLASWIPAVGLVFCLEAIAETVYTWQDSMGITHFSQQPPAHLPGQLNIIEFDKLPPAPQASNDYYSIVNQARRMEEARLKRERENLERRLAIQQAMREENGDRDGYRYDSTYVPAYYFYGRRSPHGHKRYYPTSRHPVRHGFGHRSVGKHALVRPSRSRHHFDLRTRHYPRGKVTLK